MNMYVDNYRPAPDEDIEASYREMAADQAREQQALEWSEGLIADGGGL